MNNPIDSTEPSLNLNIFKHETTDTNTMRKLAAKDVQYRLHQTIDGKIAYSLRITGDGTVELSVRVQQSITSGTFGSIYKPYEATLEANCFRKRGWELAFT